MPEVKDVTEIKEPGSKYTSGLYNYDIEEILELRIGVKGGNESKDKANPLVATTIILPQSMRIEMENLGNNYRISPKWVMERVVTHGFSILQYRYNDKFKQIKKATETLKRPQVGTVRNFMHELKVSINGVEKPQRNNISLQTNILGGISEIGKILRVEQSSIIRLCI